MIENSNVITRKVYYQMSTANKSFLDIHHFLQAKGIKNNRFFLVLLDPDLAGVDPHDPRLNTYMKGKILREVILNYWYFLREVVRIPEQGGQAGSGARYKLHRGNLALNFGFTLNWNMFLELSRQHFKTVSALCRLLYEFNFGTTSSEMMFINKKHEDSKMNLARLKDLRSALPAYLRMDESFDREGKKLKASNTVETLQHPTNGNKVKTLPAARNKVAANSLGRGCTQPRQWYDEYAFIPHVGIVYLSATPAFRTASLNAKRNGAPYGILITTTPGDLTTEEGMDAFQTKEMATPFNELFYDMSKQQLDELISKNESSSFVYIRFTYQQLGSDEQWFRDSVILMKKDWSAIRREILLEWSKASDNSPFTKEDLNIVKGLIKQPIRTIMICNYYQFNIYEELNLRYPPLIGVDVSGGFRRDSSAITVVDSKSTRVAADMNCNYISTVDLTRVIYELVTKYMNNAIVNIERNGGFGASVLSKLITTSIKRNLFYEIKDRVIEERSMGTQIYKKTQKTKVYGLDSTKNTRELLMQILRERMLYHKDKFISPIIFSELETLEVKKNGRIEHSVNGHDDQLFSYLMALYIWYEGKELMERWGLEKCTIKSDQDAEEGIFTLEEKYANIIEQIEELDDNEAVQLQEQLNILAESNKILTHEQWMQQQYNQDQAAMDKLLQTKLGRMAYAQQFHAEPANVSSGLYKIPDDVYTSFYD
jgi:hypothetical protein